MPRACIEIGDVDTVARRAGLDGRVHVARAVDGDGADRWLWWPAGRDDRERGDRESQSARQGARARRLATAAGRPCRERRRQNGERDEVGRVRRYRYRKTEQ